MKNNYRQSLVLIVSFALLLTYNSPIFSQNLPLNEISGTITDVEGPLSSVNVLVKNTSRGSISDLDGRYSIKATVNDTLLFTYLGYKPQEVAVGDKYIINLLMAADATALDQVVINAGYYKVSDREKTGSISKVTSKEIEKQPINNPLAALQGRMAGVSVTQNSGAPGSSFNIEIRGVNSLRASGSAPLYIIDGVPYNSQSLGDYNISIGILADSSSPLNSINPADIESIEILKDADATAIYGSRGANGVVLITTKKGKEGKTRLSIRSYAGIGNITPPMKMMNTEQYLSMRHEAFTNDGITEYPEYAYDVNGTWNENRYTNWREELIGGTAYFKNLQATISGGSASTQYLLSGTYRKETTVFPGDDQNNKIAVQTNLTHHSENDRFNLNLSVNYSNDKSTVRANDLTARAYILAPNAPALFDEEGNLNWENGTFDNPLANSLSQYSNLSTNLIANSVLSYKVFSELIFKVNLGYTDMSLEENRTLPSTMYNPNYGVTSANSILQLNEGARSSWIIEPQINWSKKWSDHELNLLIGTTFQSEKNTRLSHFGMGFSSNNLIHSLGAASTVQITADEISKYRYQAFFGRINYSFNDKYIINLTGRRDGSSRFGPNNRFANFGAIGAAWIFSEENFISQSLPWLSLGKIRGSYGITGNDQIGDYQFLDSYSISGNTYNGVSGIRPTRLLNPNFGWEINRKLEFAVELGLLNDRISLTSAYYRNRSSNQLVGIPLPATTGFPMIQANLDAAIENTGVETELRIVNFKTKNFSWITTFNITIPKNKLLKFEGLEGSSYENTYVVGESVNIVKLYNYVGIDPNTGTYQFEDYNNDGQITYPADRKFISDLSQKWFGGFGNRINYKNWELDFLFQFVKQKGRNYIYSMGFAGDMLNMPTYALNHWPDNGANSQTQIYTSGTNNEAVDAYYNYIDSNAAISDASFIRLKKISLSYKIPANWSNTFSGSVYLQGQNLLTFTKYKGTDPENQSIFFLPPLRQYTLGVQFNF